MTASFPYPPTGPSPMAPEPARRERSGVVDGLISAGSIIGIFVLWTLATWALGVMFYRSDTLGVWLIFVAGVVMELVLVGLLYWRARSRKQAVIAAAIALALFFLNRMTSMIFLLSYSNIIDWHVPGTVGALGIAFFFIGLSVAWTFSRGRSIGAWIGLAPAIVLALAAAVAAYLTFGVLTIVTVDVDFYAPRLLVTGPIILVAVGLCLGLVSAGDAIGVAMTSKPTGPQPFPPMPPQASGYAPTQPDLAMHPHAPTIPPTYAPPGPPPQGMGYPPPPSGYPPPRP